jgi:uncharacterized Fe-S radical SAM superfamily protein PflX
MCEVQNSKCSVTHQKCQVEACEINHTAEILGMSFKYNEKLKLESQKSIYFVSCSLHNVLLREYDTLAFSGTD